jgi:PAS domain S-box-containing protein
MNYEKILNSSSNGVVATDMNGRIIFANNRAGTLLGIPQKEFNDTAVKDTLPSIWSMVKKCIYNGTYINRQPVSDRNPGLLLNVTPLLENGKVEGCVCDFYENYHVEHIARKIKFHKGLNKELETIIDSSSDGIWVCDGQGIIVRINKAAQKLNMLQAEDYIGKHISELRKSKMVDRIVTLEVLQTKRSVSALQFNRKTNLHILISGTPAFDADGNISLVVTTERDVTELRALTDKLHNAHLTVERFKEEIAELSMMDLREQEIVAQSEAMRKVLQIALKLGNINASHILILGESGVGKGLLSKFIHQNSKCRKMSFVQINCAALPEGLLEAELFGYEKGAFTGAHDNGKVGLFEIADGGTLFLDEIGDLPLTIQAKLLKYLDDHEIMRLGGVRSTKVDCTIVAATNRNLEKRIAEKKFRQDLFYRLNTFTIRIPSLRERPEDIFELVCHFLEKFNKQYGQAKWISSEAMEQIQGYPFPGNVRELMSFIKNVVVFGESEALSKMIKQKLKLSKLSKVMPLESPYHGAGLQEQLLSVEKRILKEAVLECKNTYKMAEKLGVSQATAFRKLKKHGISIDNS